MFDDESPFVNVFTIQDKSLPVSESWIKRDDIRFDEPSIQNAKDDVPFGAMDLGVDPNSDFQVDPGQNVLPDKSNVTLPAETSVMPKKKSVLIFTTPKNDVPQYVDRRIPKPKDGGE
jgi:hypothetical protein